MARKNRKKKKFLSGLIIILCFLILLPVVSFFINSNRQALSFDSQDLSYNGDVSQVLPDTVYHIEGDDLVELPIVWHLEDFDEQKVGTQTIYAALENRFDYFKYNIGDIFIDVNVLPHAIGSTVSSGFGYIPINDGTEYAVGSYTGSDMDVVVPAVYKGKPVTRIGGSVFSGVPLTSIEFPASVKEIRDGAFGEAPTLKKINFLGRIDQWCEIEFKNTYTTPIRLFNDFYLNGELVTDVKLTTATKISSFSFYSCKSLKSIEISDTVTRIGDYAFRFCQSLENIVIPDSVISLGEYAFDGCTSLESITLSNNITNLSSHLFKDCSSLKSVEIPRSVTNIDDLVFYNTISLTRLYIPNSVATMALGKSHGVVKNCSSALTIFCEATSQPEHWSSIWNSDKAQVIWGYSGFVE